MNIAHQRRHNVIDVETGIRWKLFGQMRCHPHPHGTKTDESNRVHLNICHACSPPVWTVTFLLLLQYTVGSIFEMNRCQYFTSSSQNVDAKDSNLELPRKYHIA